MRVFAKHKDPRFLPYEEQKINIFGKVITKVVNKTHYKAFEEI